ncbi:MAG TPA: hypothetical protein PKV06_05900 [bacterium]|nr:hypothetical protein [bacterium]HMZ03744.1 hypothetical protein [bacterium]HNB08782.1 hypothetical protein [bacterium]HNB56488.1 hypothetical protein [bacterium]HNH29534.1 hypothetical protein [bacterium]
MNSKFKNTMASNILLLFVVFAFAACSVDYPEVSEQKLPRITTSGTADFTKFATVGNSLTAGYQSSGLASRFQVNSYPAIIARQLGMDVTDDSTSEFQQPLASDSGTQGILKLNFSPTGPLPSTTYAITEPFINLGLSRAYDNLAVPGAFVYDYLNASTPATGWGGLILGSANTLYTPILRGLGTQHQQLRSLHPTFVIWWEGHNDILGYATRGAGVNTTPGSSQGAPPWTPRNSTEAGGMGIPFNFTTMYTASLDSVVATGADVIVGNIPYVTDIPYFTTVYPSSSVFKLNNDSIVTITNALTGSKAKLYFEEDVTGPADSIVYMLLPVSSLIGKTNVSGFSGKPYGLTPTARIQGRYTLTVSEVNHIKSIIDGYNSIISAAAATHGIQVVDFNSYFTTIKSNGILLPNGSKIGTTFISGGLFSLDGVHPTTFGYAVVADKWIESINSKFNSNVPRVNLMDYYQFK